MYFCKKVKGSLTKPRTMTKKENRPVKVKKHVSQFIKKVYGNSQDLPVHLANELGQDIAETALLNTCISGKTLTLVDELGIDDTLFERVFLRAMLFWTLSRTALGFTAKESIAAFLETCEISEEMYPLENALRQYQRHKPAQGKG